MQCLCVCTETSWHHKHRTFKLVLTVTGLQYASWEKQNWKPKQENNAKIHSRYCNYHSYFQGCYAEKRNKKGTKLRTFDSYCITLSLTFAH